MNDRHENMEEKNNLKEESQNAEPQPQPSEKTDSAKADEAGQQLAEAGKQVEYYKDLLLRKVAEFDNFKKRVEAEAAAFAKYAKVDVIQALLPVVDDFERSLKLGKDGRESEAFAKGVELIYQKLTKFLESQGVKQIDSLGKELDVSYHDALLQVPRSDVLPHVVIEVVEKGYILDDRVLRHAKVIVSTTPADNGSGDGTNSNQSIEPDADTTTKLEN